MSIYSTFTEAILAYTGLSPAAFFTILALMVGVYRLVSAMFVSPEVEGAKRSAEPYVPPPEPVQLGQITLEELRAYDGSDPKKPLLMAIKGQVYDVTSSRLFYGPGGPYSLFAGRETSRALALMSFDPNDLTSNLEGLGVSELEVLQDWESKFEEKYVKVGQVVTEKSVSTPIEDAEEKREEKRDVADITNVAGDRNVKPDEDVN